MSFTFFNPKDPYRYDAILDHPVPKSKKHPPMPLYNRAAQFAAFRALSGYEEMVAETARLTDREWELSEEEKDLLDRQWSVINCRLRLGEKPLITITYFLPDAYKRGGRYRSLTGKVKKIDSMERRMIFYAANDYSDGETVDVDRICSIDAAK